MLHSKARRSWNRSAPTGEPGSWLLRKATRMTSTPIELGTLLDGWAASARVSVVETAPAVTVSRLDAASTQELLAATHRLGWDCDVQDQAGERSEEHTSELQSLMRISYAVFCLKKKNYDK